MKTENIVFRAILLKKVSLANDDVILEVFSESHGKVSIFAYKLMKSKKRILEIDFFRLLEFEVQINRAGNFRLKKVHTLKVYHIFSQDYKKLKQGFDVLEHLKKILPEEKPHPHFFVVLIEVFDYLEPEFFNLLILFIKVKILQLDGVMPRFDLIRGDVYLNPESLNFYKDLNLDKNKLHLDEYNVKLIFIENRLRQFLEFLRRSNLKEILDKQDVFWELELERIEKILKKIEKYH